ncbi:DNA-binding NtrC family response regulator [Desulfobaculum xiamenense]|uniref:DNA-binding NtrC family response regulator n=1 Tax=Desulfobaculum xiamenense TaxID=995050 RepID=A0A846QSL9_9BACT|nr:sigma-54 dependent transcriptional regulator [Desulfobaculum xiamenense]NJB68445.1 DNA-binding NtrC family response regulator [Desulfobaculum xiamenense]
MPSDHRAILIVDDEPSTIDSFELSLASQGMQGIDRCEDSRAVMDLLAKAPADVVLLDLVMPFVTGEELLERIRAAHPETEVVVITGIDTVDSAVTCMQAGAFDYLVKPVDGNRLFATVARALEMHRLRRENSSLRSGFLRDTPARPDLFGHIITDNPRMLRIFKYIEAIADSRQPVLITGESGTGKELVARAVHAASAASGPFVPINVAGLDDTVFSDTLFGHVRGAFTGAQNARRGLVENAAGGTLFLDEIGDLSPASQVKLLRLIQEREFTPLGADMPKPAEARVVAATHRDLESLRDSGRFRDDLFYRLCIHTIHLPPLRERKDDLPTLAEHFLRKAARALGHDVPRVPPQLHALLASHDFPGNVRELESMIVDAVSNTTGPQLPMLPFRRRIAPSPMPQCSAADNSGQPPTIAFPERLPTLSEAADQLIDEAMRRAGGKQTLACTLLGISQPALSKRLKRRTATHD